MRILVAGALANKPGYGGEAWVRLAWALGLAAQGADVLFVEQLPVGTGPRSACDPADPRVRFFEDVCRWSGLWGRASLMWADGRPLAGLPPADVLDFACGADLLVNLSGHLTLRPVLDGVRTRAYVDLDPGFTQFWHAAGVAGLNLHGHESHFTVGTNVGTPRSSIPTRDVCWLPVRQPVVMEHWPLADPPAAMRFTTVASWRGAYGPVEFQGRRYGLKVHEFRRFIDIPAVVPLPVEVALDIHPADAEDRGKLERHGWTLEDPGRVAATPAAFRDYLAGSAAELSVAQGIYVETHSGWFSDRSARYLATGRPVIVQDTGLAESLPVGEGLLVFRDLGEAGAAARALVKDYEAHCRAARLLAEEYFAADVVLPPFLERALEPRGGTLVGLPTRVAASEHRVGGAEQGLPAVPGPPTRGALVSGMVAGTPWQGGATWAALQYVLGLRRLGWDVHLVEEVDSAGLTPPGSSLAASWNARYFGALVRSFGLEGRATLVERGTGRTVGLGRDDLEGVVDRTRLLVNLSGTLRDRDLARRIPVRLYLDLDPAFTQLWHEDETLDLDLDGHTHFATVGLSLGTEDCSIPTDGVRWIPTLPPVVLQAWKAGPAPRLDAWTTVANWRGYGSIHRDGIHYGQKAHTFRDLYPLPQRTRDRFEVALAIHPEETEDLEALARHGWTLLDPARTAGTPGRYRRFVCGSAGEIGVAKSGYVVSRCGWFSDRSACYLAAGRPVVAQDTGFSRHLPVGSGLLAFDGLDDAAECVRAVRRDYARHARAARSIAQDHLDSSRVLSRLLREVDVCPTPA